MSVLEELRAIEQQVLTRLHELEPLVAEYEDLLRAAERLNLDYRAQKASPPESPRRAGAPARSRRGRRRAPVGFADRAAQVLEQVRANPGTTVPEIGKRLNVDYTGLYRIVRRLEGEGALRKSGSKLELAAGARR
jgi:winged helix-turn-helix DNA-binding protein